MIFRYLAFVFAMLGLCSMSLVAAQTLPGNSAATPVLQGGLDPSTGAVRRVGPGDTLTITVFGHPELASRVTVTAEGTITLPLLGEAVVKGLAPAGIARFVAQALQKKGLINDPKVTVDVTQVRSQSVSLLGEVYRPGRYVIAGELTLLQLLAQAGGLQATAGDVAVVMRFPTRGGPPERYEIPISPRQEPWQQFFDMPLQAGDFVQVAQQRQFFVYGEVKNAGAFYMQPGVNVMRAIALAGGLTERASERRVEIRRIDPSTGRSKSYSVDLDTRIEPGDVVFVNERFF